MPSLRSARRARSEAAEAAYSVQSEETRGSLTSWPSGYGFNDPSAIPPPGLFQTQRAGVPVTPHTSLQVDAVFTSLRIICGSIGDLGNPRAYMTELDPDNIPYRSWIKPQPDIFEQTWGPGKLQSEGMDETIMSLGLFGEFFWHVIDRDKDGYPAALDVLHPAFMKVEMDDYGRKIFEYGTPDHRVKLPREDVVHVKKMSMPGSVRGLSSIEYGGVMFAIALAATEYGQRWFAQGASPSYLLSTKGKLNKGEIDRIAEKFLFEHGGLANSHLPLILDGGMTAEKIQSTPDEAQYLQTLEYARSAIFDWFGIPLFLRNNALLGSRPEPPGVIQERSAAFIRFTLTGFLTPLTQAFSDLIPTTLNAAFDTSQFVEPDAKSLAAEILSLRNSQVMSSNEIRTRRLGLKPSAETDADKIMMPLASNVAPSQTDDSDPGVRDPANEPEDERVAHLEREIERLRADRDRRDLIDLVQRQSDASNDRILKVVDTLQRANDQSVAQYRQVIDKFFAARDASEKRSVAADALQNDSTRTLAEALNGLAKIKPTINVDVAAPHVKVEAPPVPEVHVGAPVVNVEPPPVPKVDVRVEPTQVQVDVQPPPVPKVDVRVEPTQVNVEPAQVNVDARQDAPVVNIENRQDPPIVNVDAPVVNIENKQEPPVVNVENRVVPPRVDVHQPHVIVEPQINVELPEPKKTRKRVVRNPDGRIDGIVEEDS